MTERHESGHEAPPAPPTDARDERDAFSYEGSRVPWGVVAIWLAFFVWGLAYLLRWIPESWQEWFSR